MAYPLLPWTEMTLPSPTPRSTEAPALAVLGGRLHFAWKTSDWTNRLHVTSTDGATFEKVICLDKTSPFGPALVTFNGKLYMAWTANDASNSIYLASSPNGKIWSVSQRLDYNSLKAPSLAVFDASIPGGGTEKRLCLAWAANDPSGAIYTASSPDGQHWSRAARVVDGAGTDCWTAVGSSICAVGTTRHLFGSYGSPGNGLFHLVRPPTVGWNPEGTFPLVTSPCLPACAVNGSDIYLAWASSDASGPIKTLRWGPPAAGAAPAWLGPNNLDPGFTTGQAPSIAIFAGNVVIAWVTTDLSHRIKVAYNII